VQLASLGSASETNSDHCFSSVSDVLQKREFKTFMLFLGA
jgi:hypothetical protein